MEASGNYTLPNGDKLTCDAKWKDIYPDFKMVDQNATEQATLANFMSTSTCFPIHDMLLTPLEVSMITGVCADKQ